MAVINFLIAIFPANTQFKIKRYPIRSRANVEITN